MILILTNEWDVTTDFVVRELRRRGVSFVRVNSERLPIGAATLNLPSASLKVQQYGREVPLDEVRAVWNRRPGKPYDALPFAERPTGASRRFVEDQWFAWLEALQLIEGARWMNDPNKNALMESKPRQLHLAHRLGFAIPPTLITNDPDEIRRFLKEHGPCIAKGLNAPLLEEEAGDRFVFTTDLDALAPEADASVRQAPFIVQPRLEPKTDYRITVVGPEVFAVRIEDKDEIGVPGDWRRRPNIFFRNTRLPRDIEEACLVYVERAGLTFGAIDLIETRQGWVFLELNPNGEWGWLQKPVGLPIADAVCNRLEAMTRV